MAKWGRKQYLIWALVLAVVSFGAYQFYRWLDVPGPSRFSIVTGQPDGAYYATAEQYAQQLAPQGVTLDIQPTAGSVAVMQKLVAREAPVGFVQSGTAAGFDTTGLYSLGSVFFEPVLVMYRTDHFAGPLRLLTELTGRRVGVGERGSGTNLLARQLLSENQVNGSNSNLVEAPNAEIVKLLASGDLDAAFFVLGVQSPLVAQLINIPELDLMSFGRAKAYEVRHPFLTDVVLPQGTLNLAKNIPGEDKILLATAATLVANEKLHPDSARQLLVAAMEVNGRAGVFQQANEFPTASYTELPVPNNVVQYLKSGPSDLEKYMPVSIAGILGRILFVAVPLIVLLLPLFQAAPNGASFLFRYQIYRYYGSLRKIEQYIPIYTLPELDDAVANLKQLQQKLMSTVRVPLFYQRDFYDLRLHIKLVIDRLEERRSELLNQAPAAPGASGQTPAGSADTDITPQNGASAAG